MNNKKLLRPLYQHKNDHLQHYYLTIDLMHSSFRVISKNIPNKRTLKMANFSLRLHKLKKKNNEDT